MANSVVGLMMGNMATFWHLSVSQDSDAKIVVEMRASINTVTPINLL